MLFGNPSSNRLLENNNFSWFQQFPTMMQDRCQMEIPRMVEIDPKRFQKRIVTYFYGFWGDFGSGKFVVFVCSANVGTKSLNNWPWGAHGSIFSLQGGGRWCILGQGVLKRIRKPTTITNRKKQTQKWTIGKRTFWKAAHCCLEKGRAQRVHDYHFLW